MKKLLLLISLVLTVSSCSQKVTQGLTREKQYAQLYQEQPAAIAIMPPINQTNSVEAKEFFYTTMYMPLCEKGYYVFSPYLTMELFQSEGAYDSEMFLENDISIFKDVLGAEAAMFTIIKSWKRSHIGGYLTVNVEYILRSTTTGETLYHREGMITVNTNINSGGGSLLSSIVDMAASVINTAMTDKVVAGRQCNAYVLQDLPAGLYSPLYGQDRTEKAQESYIEATVR